MTRFLALLALLAPAADDGLVAVRTARVHTGAGETIPGGVIVIRDGKILEIRRDGTAPEGARVVDASRQVVVPGLIDAHTSLADEGRDGDATIAQDVRAVDGMDFFAPARRTLAGGVTTVYASPGSRRLVSGQGAVVKTAGKDPRARVLRETWGLEITLGEPSKNPPTVFEPPVRATPDDPIRPARRQYPASRMGQFAELRRAAAGPGPLRDRRPTLVVSAHEADDLVKAVLLAEELGTGIVLVDAEEAPAVADFLAPRRIPVVLNPGFAPGHREAVPAADPRGRLDGVAALVRAGLKVALHAPDDADLRELLFIAAATVRQGLTPDEALACVTRAPAEILGVADRVGTIAPGRDADLVFLGGELFGARTVVERVMIDGDFVYERTAADVQTYRALPESGPRKEMLAIRGGRVLTATQGVIPDGLVLVEKGKVVYVGRGRPVPEGARVLDAAGLTVVPGFVDLGSQLGVRLDRTELALRKAGADAGAAVFPTSPAGLVDLRDPAFREASRSGVTSVLLAPDAAGACSLVKLSGETTAVVREAAAVKVAVRGGTAGAQALRELVQRARRYHEEWTAYERAKKEPPKPAEGVAGAWTGALEGGGAKLEASLELKADGTKVSGTLTAPFTANKAEPIEGTFEKDELHLVRKREGLEVELTLKRDGDAFKGPWRAVVAGKESKGAAEFRRPPVEPPKEPKRDELLDPWRKVLTREIPALAVTRDVPAVEAAVKVLRAEADVDVVLVDAGEAAWAGEAVAGRGVGVVLGPDVVREHRGALVNVAEALAAQGVPLGFQSEGSTATRHLALTAAWAVRHGLEPSDALRALTATPARMLRLDGRIGAIERGRDADLVLFDGEPFSPSSRVRVVIIDGRIVHEAK